MTRKTISDERKTVYYLGMGLLALGILTFGSVFVSSARNFGNFDNFENRARSNATTSFVGMIMMAAGGGLMAIGRAGVAGSGLLLDPEKAREDLEPWSRMTGGMVKDGFDEAGIDLGQPNTPPPQPEDFADRLRKLHALHQEGILSAAEYEREKAEVLEQN